MDLWHGTFSHFVRAATSHSISADMTRGFVAAYGKTPSDSEMNSWDVSLGALAEAIHRLDRTDVGVALHASGPGAGAGVAGHHLLARLHEDELEDVALPATPPPPAPARSDQELLQGTWYAVSGEEALSIIRDNE